MWQQLGFDLVGNAEILQYLLRIDAAETSRLGIRVGYFLLGEKRLAQRIGCSDIGFGCALADGNPNAHADEGSPGTRR